MGHENMRGTEVDTITLPVSGQDILREGIAPKPTYEG